MKINILSPSDRDSKFSHRWGDYWVKYDLMQEFRNRGYEIVDRDADVDLFLFGTPWWGKECTAKKRLCWIYSHPDVAREPESFEFLKQFDHIFVLSNQFLEFIKTKFANSSLLLGGTSKKYKDRDRLPKYDVVFVGGAKGRRLEIVKHLIRENKYRMLIAGGGWEGVIKSPLVDIVEYVDNRFLGDFYNKGRLTFYVGHEDMRKEGFVAVRYLDIFASSDTLCIAEDNKGLKDYFREIPQFENADALVDHLDWYLQESQWAEASNDNDACRDDVKGFTFAKIVNEIETVLKGDLK